MSFTKKICIVVATPMTLHAFFKDQVKVLSRHFDVTVVANFSGNPEFAIDWDKIKTVDIPIARRMEPVQDIFALLKLIYLFKKEQFSVVHSITPKAGLIGMMAAFIACIKIRVHTFTGQVWVTRSGIAHWLLKLIDRILGAMSTHVYADSPSQRNFLVKNKIIPFNKTKVLADGSISGVDVKRFKPNMQSRIQIRNEFSVPEDSVMLLFLGRLNSDKGVADLIHAFKLLKDSSVHLLIVGPDESKMRSDLIKIAGNSLSQIRFIDFTSEPEKMMAAADIFCLPSYREGFGSVVIEAAACGIPSVVSQIYGLTDAVVPGITGLFHPPGDIRKIAESLQKLVKNPALRKKMGMAAEARAKKTFSQERLSLALLSEYLTLTSKTQGKQNF